MLATRCPIALAAVAGVALTVTSARADQTAYARTLLTWEAPATCADREQVSTAVAALVGHAVFTASGAYDYVVHGVVEREEGPEWVAHVRLETAAGIVVGERELRRRAASCRSLEIPVTVALGLMLDLAAHAQESSPPGPAWPASPASPAPAPPSTTRKPAVVFHLPAEPSVWIVSGGISGETAWGLLPVTAFGGRLELAVQPPRAWPLVANMTVWAPRKHVTSDGIGIEMEAWQAGLGACPPLVHRRGWSLEACGGARAGVLTGSGRNLQIERTRSPVWLAASAELLARAKVAGPFRIGLGFGLMIPIGSQHFFAVIDAQRRDLHETSRVIPTARLELGFEPER